MALQTVIISLFILQTDHEKHESNHNTQENYFNQSLKPSALMCGHAEQLATLCSHRGWVTVLHPHTVAVLISHSVAAAQEVEQLTY